MKITKIEAQVKTPGRYSVFIDEKFAFGISELGLINSGLRVGQELISQQLSELQEAAQQDKIYNMALNLIMRRPRSRWEIADYLKRKKLDDLQAGKIIDQLSEKGYIDDADFAARWVESRRLLKPTSRRKLTLELRQKRVDDATIQRILDQDETDEFDVLKAEVAKKRRQQRYQDNNKLMQYLARQGYNYDDIKRALADDAG